MWTTKYMSPQAPTEDFDLFPPSAKRSREVNRLCDESVLSDHLQFDETFWRTEYHLPCKEIFGHEPFPASALFSNSSAGMESRCNGLAHEKLPHPSKLMGKRKRDQRQQGHTANVLQHIGELKMRQRHINQLKGDKWLGGTTVFRSDVEQIGLPADFNLKEMLEDASDVTLITPYEPPYSPTDQFLFPECEQLCNFAPGGNPTMALAAGTAHRSLLADEDATQTSGECDGIFWSKDDEINLFQNLEFF